MEDMFNKKPPRKVRSFSEAWKQTTGAKIAAAMAIGSIPMFIIFAQNVRGFMDSFGSGMGIMFPVFGMLAVFTLPVLLLACRFGLLGYPKIVREEEIFPILEKTMLWFKDNAFQKERLGKAIDRVGVDKLEEALFGDDLLKRKEEILAADIKTRG